jgi:hypothetical protein
MLLAANVMDAASTVLINMNNKAEITIVSFFMVSFFASINIYGVVTSKPP